jgi:hypothetical protein
MPIGWYSIFISHPANAEIISRKEKTVINDGDTLESTTIKKTPTYCGLVHFYVRRFYI